MCLIERVAYCGPPDPSQLEFIPRACPKYVVLPHSRFVIGRQAGKEEFNILAKPQLLRPLGRELEFPESHGGPFKPGFWIVDPNLSTVGM